jgi:hypothetical protein
MSRKWREALGVSLLLISESVRTCHILNLLFNGMTIPLRCLSRQLSRHVLPLTLQKLSGNSRLHSTGGPVRGEILAEAEVAKEEHDVSPESNQVSQAGYLGLSS